MTTRVKFALFRNNEQVSEPASWNDTRKHALRIKAAFEFKIRSNQSWRMKDGYQIKKT